MFLEGCLFIYLKPVPLGHKKIRGEGVIWDKKMFKKQTNQKIVLLVSAVVWFSVGIVGFVLFGGVTSWLFCS